MGIRWSKLTKCTNNLQSGPTEDFTEQVGLTIEVDISLFFHLFGVSQFRTIVQI